jgi:hypothetical protein
MKEAAVRFTHPTKSGFRVQKRGIVSWGNWNFSSFTGKTFFTTDGAGVKGLENKGLGRRFWAVLSREEKKF